MFYRDFKIVPKLFSFLIATPALTRAWCIKGVAAGFNGVVYFKY